MIRMEHPDLPGQPIRVRPAAVRAYRWSGWREAPEPEPAPEPAPEPKSSRRRRVSTMEDHDGADAA